MSRFVLAMTGASGAPYALRLLQVLTGCGHDVHLVMSQAAQRVLDAEVKHQVDWRHFDPHDLLQLNPSPFPQMINTAGRLSYYGLHDFSSPIASGSARTDGMVICPCSMGTLAAVAQGLSTNLIHRAADVHLKERRKLIVVPRETPLGTIQLENMLRLSQAGGVILPAMPGFYHQPQSIDDLVDFVVTRICDHLGLDIPLTRRWGAEQQEE